MTLDPGWILLELLVGGIGFVLVTYGKKQERFPHLVTGALFMLYPWFVTSSAGLAVGGLLLAAALWWAVRLGW